MQWWILPTGRRGVSDKGGPPVDRIPPPQAPGRVLSPSEQLLDELVFKRDLNEAHLLMDFVSGRTDRSLDQLSMLDPLTPGKTLSSSDIVRKITTLRYPPQGDASTKSDNAAFLLIAKDHLSGLARPARALTIAYTIMFAEGGGHRISRLLSGGHREEELPDSRLFLAKDIFPGLQLHAGMFRHIRTCLVLFTIVWLLLTVLTYWQVALTRSVLQRLELFYKDRVALVQTAPDLLDGKLCPRYQAGENQFNPSDKTADPKVIGACSRLHYIDRSRHEAHLDLDNVVDCQGVWPNLVTRILGWRNVQCRPMPDVPTPGHYAVSWQSATSVLSAFNTYVLPMMFGLLGTLIAALRSIQNKVRDSLLEPRDLVLMLLGLPLGLVAGVAVGLFFSPSGAALPGSATLAGDLSLTVSGLGFLTGYGAEAFFKFMDGVLARAFPDRAAANSQAGTASH
jgi:hypothetical protein